MLIRWWWPVSRRRLSRTRRWITAWLRTITVHCSRRTVIWLCRCIVSLLLGSIRWSILVWLTRSIRRSLWPLVICTRILISVLSGITLLRRLLGITLRTSVLLRTWCSWRSIYGGPLARHYRPTIATLCYWLALIKA